MVDGMSDMGTTELGAASTPEQARAAFRDGLVRPTCGIAQGYAQANLMILPKEQAFDFLLFAQRNPKPCPLLEVMEPGDVPVFWACGVTPQAAVMASKPEFAITHAPGHMFITSKRDLEYMV